MKVEQLMEMAAKQVCSKCGRGPISKTHRWVVGSGWKCMGGSAKPADDKKAEEAPAKKEEPVEKKEAPAHRTAGKSHVTDAGARKGLEDLFKRQKSND